MYVLFEQQWMKTWRQFYIFVLTNEIIVPWEKYAYNTNGHAPWAMVPNTEIGQLQNR
jgi:hypothetical protein